MKEYLELRIVEEFAGRLFRTDEGKKLGSGLVRLVKIPRNDPRIDRISALQREVECKSGRAFYHGWEILRQYSKAELAEAAYFRLIVTSHFEPAGEECGTKYDDSSACRHCYTGAKRVGPLVLDISKIPKGKDIAATIAGEVIVSQRLREIFEQNDVPSSSFHPVHTAANTTVVENKWYDLEHLEASAEIVPPTKVGIDPFDDDTKGEYRCPRGDLLGLNLLSEVFIKPNSVSVPNLMWSRQFVGIRRGLLRPERILLLSAKLRQSLVTERIIGCQFEVAHLVS